VAKPFVSVLIDTYNQERFIEKAIVSVLEQDFPPSEREIIVVDDGSTDGTPAIVRRFEPRLQLMRKPNGGQASAFNVGIPQCKGEIVSFLDGDDWWASDKLTKVIGAMEQDDTVGLIGHGVAQVFPNGEQHIESLRETAVARFRLDSEQGAKVFRLRKSFLGTSRMTCRRDVLRKIGKVPETLTFEADEYLFSLAGLFADVLVLREPLTFYRLHDQNLFQIRKGSLEGNRKKHQILTALVASLRKAFAVHGLRAEVANIIVEWVQTEADTLGLIVNGGFPWETVRTELRSYSVFYENASVFDWAFKGFTLLPACVLPPPLYYSWRQRWASNKVYREVRKRWAPNPELEHVDRYHGRRP
jgi:glycosyltransferase involved in cell wall biosynthesis